MIRQQTPKGAHNDDQGEKLLIPQKMRSSRISVQKSEGNNK